MVEYEICRSIALSSILSSHETSVLRVLMRLCGSVRYVAKSVITVKPFGPTDIDDE